MNPHELINKIIEKKEFLEENLGDNIEFFMKEDVISTSVNLFYDLEADILSMSAKEKEMLINWIIKILPMFKQTLQPIIKEIN
jgi:hypothetical protein